MGTTKDISIGKDKWIKWVDFEANSSSLIEIDLIIEPIKGFLKNLETECVAACCGIDAFAFWSEDIRNALKDYNSFDLLNELEKIKSKLLNLPDSILIGSFLNQLIDKGVFIELIDHIVNEINIAHNTV